MPSAAIERLNQARAPPATAADIDNAFQEFLKICSNDEASRVTKALLDRPFDPVPNEGIILSRAEENAEWNVRRDEGRATEGGAAAIPSRQQGERNEFDNGLGAGRHLPMNL